MTQDKGGGGSIKWRKNCPKSVPPSSIRVVAASLRGAAGGREASAKRRKFSGVEERLREIAEGGPAALVASIKLSSFHEIERALVTSKKRPYIIEEHIGDTKKWKWVRGLLRLVQCWGGGTGGGGVGGGTVGGLKSRLSHLENPSSHSGTSKSCGLTSMRAPMKLPP